MWESVDFSFDLLSEGIDYSGWLPTALENMVAVGEEAMSLPGCAPVVAGNMRSVHKASIFKVGQVVLDSAYFYVDGTTVGVAYNLNGWQQRAVGTLASATGFVSWAESSSQNTYYNFLFITDETALYRVNLLEDLATLEQLDAMPHVNGDASIQAVPARISMYEHRLLLTCKNSSQWFYSKTITDDSSDYFDDRAFYSAESRNDRTKALVSMGHIYALGSNSVEVWDGTGGVFPYAENVVDEGPFGTNTHSAWLFGVKYPNAIAQGGNSLYFIAQGAGMENTVVRVEDSGYTVVSNPQIVRQISRHRFTQAFIVKVLGVELACFKQEDGNILALNTSTGMFSLLTEWSTALDGFSSNVLATTNGLMLLDEARPIAKRKRVMFPIKVDLNRFLVRELELKYRVQGNPPQKEAGTEQQLWLSFSHDGGKSWSPVRVFDLRESVGSVKTFGLGFARDLVLDIQSTSQRPLVLSGVRVSYELTAR